MRRPRISYIGLAWIVIGLIVAANRHYLTHLDTLGHIFSAILAVLVWPLVLLGIHISV